LVIFRTCIGELDQLLDQEEQDAWSTILCTAVFECYNDSSRSSRNGASIHNRDSEDF
jgi:hypothetical protein